MPNGLDVLPQGVHHVTMKPRCKPGTCPDSVEGYCCAVNPCPHGCDYVEPQHVFTLEVTLEQAKQHLGKSDDPIHGGCGPLGMDVDRALREWVSQVAKRRYQEAMKTLPAKPGETKGQRRAKARAIADNSANAIQEHRRRPPAIAVLQVGGDQDLQALRAQQELVRENQARNEALYEKVQAMDAAGRRLVAQNADIPEVSPELRKLLEDDSGELTELVAERTPVTALGHRIHLPAPAEGLHANIPWTDDPSPPEVGEADLAAYIEANRHRGATRGRELQSVAQANQSRADEILAQRASAREARLQTAIDIAEQDAEGTLEPVVPTPDPPTASYLARVKRIEEADAIFRRAQARSEVEYYRMHGRLPGPPTDMGS